MGGDFQSFGNPDRVKQFLEFNACHELNHSMFFASAA